MAVVLFIHHHQPPGHLACNRSLFTPRACPPAPSCDQHQHRPQHYQHHHFPHRHQIAAARNRRRRPTTTTGLHISADNNAHGSTPPPFSSRRRPGDDKINKADGDDDDDDNNNKNNSDISSLSSSQSAFIIPLPRATLTIRSPESLEPRRRRRRRRPSKARKPSDVPSSTTSILSDSADANASTADSNKNSDSSANKDTNSSTSSSSRPSATSAGRNALNRPKPLDHNNDRHDGRGNNGSSNNNSSSINSSGNNNNNKRGNKKAAMNPTYFTMTTDYSDWSSDFLTLCNEQLSVLMDTMPDVRLVALFFRHENEAEGALEFVPLIVHSCDPEENKPARVWISSGAGGGLTELENKDVSSRVLPGGVPANWILPDYPFTSESHHGGILLPDGGLCVPVEYNDVIAGTIIIRPKVAWSTTATSTTTTLNDDDDDDDDDDNDMPKSRWSVSDIRRVDLVARSIALAAALEGKWHAYKGLLGTTRTLLESVRSLLRTTLHQIRSPLQALVTFGNLMMRKLPVKDSNRDLAKHVIVEALRVDELLKPLDEAREKLVLPEAPPKQNILSHNESLKRAFDTHPEMLFEDFGLASVDVEKRRAAAAARRSAASAAAARRGGSASQLGVATGRQQQQQPRRRSRGRGRRAKVRDERDDDDDDVFSAFRGEQDDDDDDFLGDDDEDDEDFGVLTDDIDNLRSGSIGANGRRKPRGSAGAARPLNGPSKRSTGRRTKVSSRSQFSTRASGRRLNSPLPPAYLSDSEEVAAGEDDKDDELPEMFTDSYYNGDDDEQEEDRDSSAPYMDTVDLDTEYASTRDGLQLLWLADVLQAQLERAQVLANSKGLRFHARLTADSGPVMAVGKFVREAISNLLDNAIKYSPRGAYVGVTSVDMDVGVGLDIMEEDSSEEDADDMGVADDDDSNDSADSQQRQQQKQQQRPRGRQRRQRKERDGRRLFDLPPDSCGVVVWDTGYGFQAEEMGRVWEYGFRGSAARRKNVGGSGLGLGITEQLLRSCAATVELMSPLPRALDPRRDSERAANPQLKGAAFVITFRKPTRKVRDSTNAETRAVDFFEDDYAEEDDEIGEEVENGRGGSQATTDSGTGDADETEQREDADIDADVDAAVQGDNGDEDDSDVGITAKGNGVYRPGGQP